MSNKIWIAKRDAYRAQDENPNEAVVKFGVGYGKRGLITLSENIRENGMLVFKSGCRMTKGKYAEVLHQAKIWEDSDNHNSTAAVDRNVSPNIYQKSLSYLHSLIESGDLVVDRTDKADGTVIAAHLSNWLFKWTFKSDLIQVYARKDKQKAWKQIEQFSTPGQLRNFYVFVAKTITKYLNMSVTADAKASDVSNNYKALISLLKTEVDSKKPIIPKLIKASSYYEDILRLPSNIEDEAGVVGFGGSRMLAGRLFAKVLSIARIKLNALGKKYEDQEFSKVSSLVAGIINKARLNKVDVEEVTKISQLIYKTLRSTSATSVGGGIDRDVFKHDDFFWKRELTHAGFDVDKNTIGLVQDLYYKYASSCSNAPIDKIDEPKFFDKFIAENKKRIALMTGNARKLVASKEVTADGELSDRASSIIFGDLKRIRSTIASWQGKMKPEEYKEFVAYQKAIAKFIKDHYVPKLSATYKDKVSKL